MKNFITFVSGLSYLLLDWLVKWSIIITMCLTNSLQGLSNFMKTHKQHKQKTHTQNIQTIYKKQKN